MINPGFSDLDCPQGATFTKRFTLLLENVPVNLSGYSARLQVRESYDSLTPVVSLTSGSGITLGGTAGTIDVSVSATVTAGIPAAQYVYDLELQTGASVDRWLQGSWVVSPEVSR